MQDAASFFDTDDAGEVRNNMRTGVWWGLRISTRPKVVWSRATEKLAHTLGIPSIFLFEIILSIHSSKGNSCDGEQKSTTFILSRSEGFVKGSITNITAYRVHTRIPECERVFIQKVCACRLTLRLPKYQPESKLRSTV